MRIIKIFLPIFMVFTVVLSLFSQVLNTSEAISNKVFRLHILANSDSTYDQNIKLQLRDYFLNNTADIFCEKTLDETIKTAKNNLSNIENICNTFLKSNNCPYTAKVSVTKEYFSTRVYDDFTLPAGCYNSLKISIGQGSGHNWWCIVFPSVCLSSCSESMGDYMTDEEMDFITESYYPKFKMIEIYEKIKSSV